MIERQMDNNKKKEKPINASLSLKRRKIRMNIFLHSEYKNSVLKFKRGGTLPTKSNER